MTGFLARTNPFPTPVTKTHFDVIDDLRWLSFYRHPLQVSSGLFGNTGLNIGGVAHHAAAQARVGNPLPNNGLRLIIDARRAYLGLKRLTMQFAGLTGLHPRYTKIRIQLFLTNVRF